MNRKASLHIESLSKILLLKEVGESQAEEAPEELKGMPWTLMSHLM